MSKPVFSDLFRFEGRRNRLSYLLVQLATWVGTAVGIFVGAYGLAIYDTGGAAAVGASALILFGFLIAFASILAAWITSAQRVRDMGHSGWFVFLQLIPYIGFVAGLVIAFVPGDTKIENRFGASCI